MSDETVAASRVPSVAGPLGYDVNFESRWDAWRDRGRAHEAAFARKARIIVPLGAVLGALALAWLVR